MVWKHLNLVSELQKITELLKKNVKIEEFDKYWETLKIHMWAWGNISILESWKCSFKNMLV